jgi:cytidylate kinase
MMWVLFGHEGESRMRKQVRSVENLIEEQVRRWDIRGKEKPQKLTEPVIAVSRLPGSGGRQIVKTIGRVMGFDIFDAMIIQKIAEDARLSSALIKTLDERGVSMVEDWVLAVLSDRYLWRQEYLKLLARFIHVIGKQGRGVILGRGASFILPPAECLRVLVVAPLEVRIKNVAGEFGCSAEEARKRVVQTEAERRAFIRQHFQAELTDPALFDLIINTEFIGVTDAVETIRTAWSAKRTPRDFTVPLKSDTRKK